MDFEKKSEKKFWKKIIDKETKIKLYGLAIMAAIYPAGWLIGFIIDWWHVIPSWLLEMVGLILGSTIFILSAMAAFTDDNYVIKYIGIGVSIVCVVLFLYFGDFSGSESCYSFRGGCI